MCDNSFDNMKSNKTKSFWIKKKNEGEETRVEKLVSRR